MAKEEKVEGQDPIVEGTEASEPTPILEEQQEAEGTQEVSEVVDWEAESKKFQSMYDKKTADYENLSRDANELQQLKNLLDDRPDVVKAMEEVLTGQSQEGPKEPIEPEAFGRITAEACSMTKPVIATNHGGSREIIENNLSGWLVKPGDPEALGEKIIHVLNLEQKKKDLIGRNARKRIVEKFNLKQMLDKTINVYEELIEAKKNFGS